MGAACTWKTARKWTGQRFRLGTNKETFDAEAYAIYQAPGIIDRKQESGHQYTMFADSTFAIDRVRSDALGPGQRFAVASIEVCAHINGRNNEAHLTRETMARRSQATRDWISIHVSAECRYRRPRGKGIRRGL